MKFKVGDEVIVINYQPGRVGTLKLITKEHKLYGGVSQKFIWLVDDGSKNMDYWNYKDSDIRKLTKLEKALK